MKVVPTLPIRLSVKVRTEHEANRARFMQIHEAICMAPLSEDELNTLCAEHKDLIHWFYMHPDEEGWQAIINAIYLLPEMRQLKSYRCPTCGTFKTMEPYAYVFHWLECSSEIEA